MAELCTSISQQVVNFQLRYWGGCSMNTSCKNPNCKVLSHLGLKSNVLAGLLTDLSVLVEFCKESPQQSVKIEIRYLRVGSINIPCKFPTVKLLPTWRLCQGISLVFNWQKCFGGICTSRPEQGVKWNIQNRFLSRQLSEVFVFQLLKNVSSWKWWRLFFHTWKTTTIYSVITLFSRHFSEISMLLFQKSQRPPKI